MRLRYIALAILVLSATQMAASLPQLPLTFEPNHGQAPEGVRFLAHRSGYTVYLSETDAVLLQNTTWLRAHLVGANHAASMSGLEQLNSRSNYLIGNEARNWRRGIPNYARVMTRNVYDGIDLTWYGRDGQLEYDFVVAPGADVDLIEIEFLGADKVTIESTGDLLLHTAGGVVRQRKPVVYQEKREIAGRYVRRAQNRIGFSVASYDRSKELIIDPVLVYSTYVGGSSYEVGGGIAVDGAGSAYIVGGTASFNFPTMNPFQGFKSGGDLDIYVAKLNAAGTALEYSTYLGGMATDRAIRVAVDASGNAYICGETNSMNFPIANAVQPSFGGGNADGFVAKLDASGSNLLFATYLGGSAVDRAHGVAVDLAGNVYVTGVTQSFSFPTMAAMKATLSGPNDAFVTKIAAAGTPLLYSTFHGGSGVDVANRIAVDNAGNAYVTGFTDSLNFPLVNAFQSTV